MTRLVALMGIACVLCGCITAGPVISKSDLGNLEINVLGPEGQPVTNAELFLDGVFVGNLTERLPVIHARRGERLIAVRAAGFGPYEKKISVLGDPNHQVLNITLQKQ